VSADRDTVQVVLDWTALGGQQLLGELHHDRLRGQSVVAFEYAPNWFAVGRGLQLDPELPLGPGRTWPRRGTSPTQPLAPNPQTGEHRAAFSEPAHARRPAARNHFPSRN